MNKYWNYPKRKSSANGKLQPCARGATQQDVEMPATKQGRQHGDVGQRKTDVFSSFLVLGLCW